MDTNELNTNDKFVVKFCKDGTRVWVDPFGREFRFRPDDAVKLIPHDTQIKEGPYVVERVTDDGKYVLCDDQGTTVKDGKAFEESELVEHDPFEV